MNSGQKGPIGPHLNNWQINNPTAKAEQKSLDNKALINAPLI